MNPSLLDQMTRLQLTNQLVYFDEEKIHFLDHYFPDHNQKRRAAEKTLADYTSVVESILRDLNEETLNSVALIGSKLELRYLDDGSTESYTIVFPDQTDPASGHVSFLSPIGFQLLMTRRDDVRQLAVPYGETSVKVEEVKFVNHGTVHERF
ncbi:GreA/GreB family elongation factor [Gorillibacterium massiliense]|uniref:GreA/GreB family elongation factor n=1 Tax=Gorillibacterium massiliense TaxID=1280390 RepID=UPI0004BA5043|nr:GreA/GreB family elongation factor [Gorillibacterium massiliense]